MFPFHPHQYQRAIDDRHERLRVLRDRGRVRRAVARPLDDALRPRPPVSAPTDP